MAKSVEELVEDWAKKSLGNSEVSDFAKNAAINSEIGAAKPIGLPKTPFPLLDKPIPLRKGQFAPLLPDRTP